MKIQLLVGIDDSDYLEHLSQMLAQRYADLFEVSACSTQESLAELLASRHFEVALLTSALAEGANLKRVALPLLLWDGAAAISSQAESWKRLRKYQRISTLTGEILEHYASVSNRSGGFDASRAHITVVWSPAGGSGKTTAALALAAQRVAEGKQAAYLNLEYFSSGPVYFAQTGKSISTVFEKLDEDVAILMQGIRQQDGGSGIGYYGRPDNYEDINILTVEDIENLVAGSASGLDELVVDTSSVWDDKVRSLFKLADTVLIVVDTAPAAQAKWEQFCTQHNVYSEIAPKIKLTANRGARLQGAQVNLPYVQAGDPVVVYKTLSAGYFGA